VLQRLVDGKIDSCSSRLFEQYIPQLKGRVRHVSKTKERHVWQPERKERVVGRNQGVLNEITGLTLGTLPCTSSERGKKRQPNGRRGQNRRRVANWRCGGSTPGQRGEVSAEALEPVQMRQGGPRRELLSFRPVTPCTRCPATSWAYEAEISTKRAPKVPKSTTATVERYDSKRSKCNAGLDLGPRVNLLVCAVAWSGLH
jgi:hypothetical protein